VDANLLDALLGIGLAWAAFRGWQTGIVRSLIGLAGLLLAYFAALYYGESAGAQLFEGTLGAIAGIVLVFGLVLVLFYFVGRMAQAFLHATPLGIVDTFAGGLLGTLKATLVFGLLLILAQNEPLHSRIPGVIEGSAIARPVQNTSLFLIDWISVAAPEVARFLNEADIQLPGERPPVIKTLTEGTGKFTEKIGEIVNESKKQLEARK
jgi:membrane protein required for colicin V production